MIHGVLGWCHTPHRCLPLDSEARIRAPRKDPRPYAVGLFPFLGGVSGGMAKKRVDRGDFATKWWWVCHLQPDSNRIFRWFPFYNCVDAAKAKVTLRALAVKEEGFRKEDWRYFEPGSDKGIFEEQTARAIEGYCPKCGAKPKHSKQGRSKGYRAWKCGKCEWTWRIPGSRDPNYVAPEPPTSPSKPSGRLIEGPVPEAKAKKPKKGKKKKGKRKAKD